MPGTARFPSTVTRPLSMSRSASLLEQIPAALRYLFSLIIFPYPVHFLHTISNLNMYYTTFVFKKKESISYAF